MEMKMAVKAFIVNNGKVLVVEREKKDINSPGIWEIPGGRLDKGEEPSEGLKREVQEETGLDVEVIMPFAYEQFSHPEDGQKIMMFHFLCKSKNTKINLSSEHTKFDWVEISKSRGILSKYFHHVVDSYERLGLEKQF